MTDADGKVTEFKTAGLQRRSGGPHDPHDGLHGLPQPAGAQVQLTQRCGRQGHRPGPDRPDHPVGQEEGRRGAGATLCDQATRPGRRSQNYLRAEYPGRPAGRRADRSEVQAIYQRNFFPEMKADWRVYPDHISHKNWAGCFRCHDGSHKAADGETTIKASDCTTCHIILAQGSTEEELLESQRQGLRLPPRRLRILGLRLRRLPHRRQPGGVRKRKRSSPLPQGPSFDRSGGGPRRTGSAGEAPAG